MEVKEIKRTRSRDGACTHGVRMAMRCESEAMRIKEIAVMLDFKFEFSEISSALARMRDRGEVVHVKESNGRGKWKLV